MENKNLIIAIALSLVVMVGWTYIADHFGLIPERPVPTQAPQQTTPSQTPAQGTTQSPAAVVATDQALPMFTPSEGRDILIETPLYKAVLYSGGATLRSFELKNYAVSRAPKPWITIFGVPFGQVYSDTSEQSSANVNLVPAETAAVAPLGLLVNGLPSWSVGQWTYTGKDVTLKDGENATLEFTGEVDGIRVVRAITFSADTYAITEKTRIVSLGDQTRAVRLGYSVGENNAAASNTYYDAMRIAWFSQDEYDETTDVEELASPGLQLTGVISWAGAMSTYFMSAVAPAITDNVTIKARYQNDVYRVVLQPGDIPLAAGTEQQQDVTYWLGPKVKSLLEAAPNNLAQAVDLGFFGSIGNVLLICLNYLQGYVHNWGIAIMLLTVGIKIIFWPLTAKSYASMAKMRKLQPEMVKLRERYADDKEALNRETMNLYKTYGANPMSGCMPILVQLPVFFGLYQALLSSIELRQASFITYLPGTDMLWLSDLSSPDPFYITPIIMGVSMFLMQKMNPPMGDPTQQKIMMFMPIIFTFMFLSFPSGLVLYWIVNNLLSMAQQYMLIRKASKMKL